MTVNDLSMLEPMQQFRIVAGFDGLFRKVTGISILEHESVTGNYDSFSRGDFIITTMFFAKDDPGLVLDTLRELISRDMSGIAIKTVCYRQLPSEIIAYADECRFPVFFFDDVRMTDIILYAYNLLNARKESAFFESRIRNLFPPDISESDVLQCVAEINPALHNKHYCAFLTPQTPSAVLLLEDTAPAFQKSLSPEKKYASLLRYQNGWLLIASFPEDKIPADPAAHCRKLLAGYHLNPAQFCCGISRIGNDLKQFDISLNEALSASRLAQHTGSPCLSFEEIGLFRFLLPQMESRTFLADFHITRNILEDYDRKYNSRLLDTMRTFVASEGSISQTAKTLFLHVNTVRYRLNKIKELLHMHDFHVQAALFIKTYDYLYPDGQEG